MSIQSNIRHATILAIVPVGLTLGGCQNAPTPVSAQVSDLALKGLSNSFRCQLTQLVTTNNAVQSRDAEFERASRAMDWQFTVSGTVVQSQGKAPGGAATSLDVPVASVSSNVVLAEGPIDMGVGRATMRIEIQRQSDRNGKHHVRQTRTWKMPEGSPTTLMPFHAWSTHVVIWSFECVAQTKSQPPG